MKKLSEFLPKPTKPKVNVQPNLDEDLHAKTVAQFKADRAAGIKMTWDSLLEAACKQYLLERKSIRAS